MVMKFEAQDMFEVKNYGWVFSGKSPISCKRDFDSFKDAFGTQVEVNSMLHTITNLDSFCILSDIKIGENIGVLVKLNQEEQEHHKKCFAKKYNDSQKETNHAS